MDFYKFYKYARSCLILHHFECYWYKCSSNINLQCVFLLLWYSSQNSGHGFSLGPFKNHLDATVIFFQILNWSMGKSSNLKEFGRNWDHGSSQGWKLRSAWQFSHCFCESSILRVKFSFWSSLKLNYMVSFISFQVLLSCMLGNISVACGTVYVTGQPYYSQVFCCCDRIISQTASVFFPHFNTWLFKLRATFNSSFLISIVNALSSKEKELKCVFYYFLRICETS